MTEQKRKSKQLRYYEQNKEKYRKYDREKYYKPIIRIRKENTEMIEFIKAKPNISAYIQDLIREDMNRNNNSTSNTRMSGKRIQQYDLNGNLIKEYINVEEAAKRCGLDPVAVWRVANKKENSIAGCIFKYK